jgi:hypothetical protein
VLDRGWLERSTRHLNIGIGTTDHPLALKWATTGAGAFIELNALAEDLRLVSGISGAGSVIEDCGTRLDSQQPIMSFTPPHYLNDTDRGRFCGFIRKLPSGSRTSRLNQMA